MVDHERINQKLGSDFNIDDFSPEDVEQDECEQSETLSLSSLSPEDQQWVDVEVTLGLFIDSKAWLEAEGTFEQGDGKINFEAPDENGSTIPAEIEQGDNIEVRDAHVTTGREGQTILELRPGVMEIVHADDGVGSQQGLNDHADEEVTASKDGGSAGLDPSVHHDAMGSAADMQRLVALLHDEGQPLKQGSLFEKAAERFDMDPSRAESALEKALQKGDIYESVNG